MLRSLVGSEMCIRDRILTMARDLIIIIPVAKLNIAAMAE